MYIVYVIHIYGRSLLKVTKDPIGIVMDKYRKNGWTMVKQGNSYYFSDNT